MLFRKKVNFWKKRRTWIDRLRENMCFNKRNKSEERKGVLEVFYGFFLSPPKNRKDKNVFGKASFCSSFHGVCKASLAVETALVLPVFFLGMVTMISFMDIYQVQTEHLTELCEKAKKAGMYAYAADQKEIILPDVYVYEPVGGWIPLSNIWMHNTVKVHAWTGESFAAVSDSGNEEQGMMVYVTENGSVYHKKAGCSYLNLSVTTVSGSRVSSMRNQYGEKYGACETCSRNQKPLGSVYITEAGNKYHNLASCSCLKRTVKLVKHSHAAGMKACSRCG